MRSVLFETHHLYYLPNFLPIIDELKHRGGYSLSASIPLTINADAPRLIAISTSVWGEQIEWQDGHTIEMIQTNDPEKWSTTSEDGNGGGIEFTPVDGTIELKVENKSDKTFYYEIYERK